MGGQTESGRLSKGVKSRLLRTARLADDVGCPYDSEVCESNSVIELCWFLLAASLFFLFSVGNIKR